MDPKDRKQIEAALDLLDEIAQDEESKLRPTDVNTVRKRVFDVRPREAPVSPVEVKDFRPLWYIAAVSLALFITVVIDLWL